MEINHRFKIIVKDPSHVAEARRLGVSMAEQLGFNETDRGKVAIAITELATNLVKHAKQGEILLQVGEDPGAPPVVEVYALDKGPGMLNVVNALRDGFSTAGSPGNGLGAILRLSEQFDIYAPHESGSVFFVGFSPGKVTQDSRIGGISIPLSTEKVCGDAWSFASKGHKQWILVADGLGHGPMAAEASRQAVKIFQRSTSRAPADVLDEMHSGLRQTRGAAVAVAEIDSERNRVFFAGVGNISGVILSSGKPGRNMVSHNGTLGHEVYKIQEFQYDLTPDSVIVMHSDGLKTHWDLAKYPGILSRTSSVIAGLLYRDFDRVRDDTTVVVFKTNPQVFKWNG